MPSQEDYRDELLEEMSEEDGGFPQEDGEALDLEDLAGMSEEEIAGLLAAGEAGRQDFAQESLGDVLDLDTGGQDDDLLEIQDMLERSDRNEAVEAAADFQEEDPAGRLLADIEEAGETETVVGAVDAREAKRLEKKRLKEEKKAAKAAAKAQKQEARKAKKGGGKEQRQTGQEPPRQQCAPKPSQQDDLLADRELLDSIVSGAGMAEGGDASGMDLMELASSLAAGRNGQEVPYEEDAESATDMDSDVLTLDMDEVDALIPDITENARKKSKKGMLSRFVDFLMEEEPENEDIRISEENQEIIRDLDKEDGKKGKKKESKKGQKKEKEKKKKEPKPKKEKAPKPKKEKKPKEKDPYPGRKLSWKKVLPIVLLGASVGAVLLICVELLSDFSGKQAARTAFRDGDYQACYLNLYGKRLNEAEEQMYGKSESILQVRMWQREYEQWVREGNELRALDSLIQSVYEYPALEQQAFFWGAEIEVREIYNEILGILYGKYGVSEEQAQEIAALASDIDYTRAVVAAAEAAGFGEAKPLPEDGSQSAAEDGTAAQPDTLQEETELESGSFVDNQ